MATPTVPYELLGEVIQFIPTLLNCADEPIHRIGHIQSFAVLFAVDINTFQFEVVSANSTQVFAENPASLLEKNFSDVFKAQDKTQVQLLIDQKSAFKEQQIVLHFKDESRELPVCTYRYKDYIVFEHELLREPNEVTATAALSIMHRLTVSGGGDTTISSFAQTIAEEVKAFTDFDRVMIYKFHRDGHGEVIAESKNAKLESYLGLHYPESDIPHQARQLYKRNITRLICDINSQPIALIGKTKDIQYQFDLSDSISRSVSPVHIQYLKNMGVGASMSVSIMLNNELWGLIACHHYADKFLSVLHRSFCATMGDTLASRIGKLEAQALKEARAQASKCILDIVSSLSAQGMELINSEKVERVLKNNLPDLLKLTDSQGFYLHVEDLQFCEGLCPHKKDLARLRQNLVNHAESTYVEEDGTYENSDGVKIPGVLAVKVPNDSGDNWIAWFRPEHIHSVRWAGKDDKSMVVDNGISRLTPRGSFAEFERTHVGRSQEFTEVNMAGAQECFSLISSLLLTYWNESKKLLESLRETDQAKDTFIGIISHELRTPLNNILGWIQIMEHQISQSSELFEGFTVIKENAFTQLQIVNDLLDISRMITGKLHLQVGNVHFNELIKIVVKSLEPMAMAKGVKLHLEGADQKVLIYADDDRIRQVVRNIVHNALKFTSRGGSITIKLETSSSLVKLEVIDTGIGIDRAKLGDIFNKFYQVDSKASRVYRGLGLGLAISKSIVELSGGRILIDSAGVNKGTTVSVFIPLANIETESKPTTESTARPNAGGELSGLKVLLLEDQTDSVRFMTMAINIAGAHVSAALHASEALEILKRKSDFDVILSDIGLPEIDGYEFLRLAKEQIPNLPPVIALTAHGRQQDLETTLAAGFASHVVKPVKLKELFDSIRKVIHDKKL